MPDFLISSLRGGQSEDIPISLADDACTICSNVEFVKSELGERRLGAVEIDLTGSGIEAYSRVVWMYHHHPTPDHDDTQLWILAVDDAGPTATFVYKDVSGWTTVVPTDAINTSNLYSVVGQTLHGKLFIAYDSAVDRLHVFDGIDLRRTGLAEPAAPSVAETGAGSFSGIRYYRVRYTVQSGGITLRRSEPSDTTTYDPADFGSNGASARVTKPASISEDETHWEVEASVDNANFYRIATVAVGTTTYDDSTSYTSGYATLTDAVLSEDIGDYSLIPSARFLTVIDDRLMAGGSFEDDALASRVMWTPVLKADGVGNDERLELDTDPFVDLDNYEGGDLTGLSIPLSGYVFATKHTHIYQLNKSGVRTAAYEVNVITKARGAIESSMISATDNLGNPTLFALDPDIGPIRFSPRGVEPAGLDLWQTWDTVNLDATLVVCRVVYFHEKQQIHWFVATGASNIPDKRIVVHTSEVREAEDGTRRGWVIWDGDSAAALAVCMFHENVDDLSSGPAARHIPLIGVVGSGLIWATDQGGDDNGTAYHSRIVTKPYVRANLLNRMECKSASIFAKAVTDATINVTVHGMRADAGEVTKEVTDIDFTALSGETDFVIRHLDNLSLADLNTLQLEIEDTTPAGTGQWVIGQIAIREVSGQKS